MTQRGRHFFQPSSGSHAVHTRAFMGVPDLEQLRGDAQSVNIDRAD